ncbi:uncharacterized protein LOC131063370 [Cryptomeria japonica]|uniref:uncharacterized protein LOC131063370 n=1 Tax=Cryptomeria japonica TaxID=3369 RepID=UPI0025ACFD4C|nr:uncharacterized protein LOC131063370 [Cryptomeria japonica]
MSLLIVLSLIILQGNVREITLRAPLENSPLQHQQKCIDKLKEEDKVRVLDTFDGVVVGIGKIHSLSIIHGVNLKGTGDANVNILKVTSNIPLSYEDKIDGVVYLKEKEGTFT